MGRGIFSSRVYLKNLVPRYSVTTIIDGITENIGRCSLEEFNTRQLCRTEGGSWKYAIDISGKSSILLDLILCCLTVHFGGIFTFIFFLHL